MPKRKPVLESFGKRLAALRKEAGFTQRKLAAELGISQRMVAYYESQTDQPPAHLLPAIAKVFAITTDELLGLKSERPPAAKPKNPQLWRRFRQIEKLPLSERRQLLGVIDAVLERHRLREAS